MMGRFGVLLLAALVVSGCASAKSAAPASSDAPMAVVEGGVTEGGATIRGVVVDDGSSPLAGALVGILELNLQLTTPTEGSFEFRNIPPGTYQVSANKLGYDSVGERVEAAEGDDRAMVLTLSQLAVVEAYVEVYGPYKGYYECAFGLYGVGTGSCSVGATGPNTNIFEFQLTSPKTWRTIYGELRWTPAAVATSPALAGYITYEGGSSRHWWCASDGPSPNWFRYDVLDNRTADDDRSVCSDQGQRDPAPEDPKAIEGLYMATDPGFPGLEPPNDAVLRLTFQQKFEAMLTVFYLDPAADGYSGFPDQ